MLETTNTVIVHQVIEKALFVQLYLKLTIHNIQHLKLTLNKKEAKATYKPLEVLGPEHEYSLVDKDLKVLANRDKIIKDYCGKIINFIELPNFTFGKEMQLHVMEIKANQPFKTPSEFEETMQNAVSTLSQIVEKHGAMLAWEQACIRYLNSKIPAFGLITTEKSTKNTAKSST